MNSTDERRDNGSTDTSAVDQGQKSSRGWLDKKLENLGKNLSDPDRRREWRAVLGGRLRKLLWWITVAFLGFTSVGLLLASWVGERNLLAAVILYVPPLTWLLPVVPLAMVALLLSRKLFGILTLWGVLYLVFYMDFGVFRGGEDGGEGDFELTVLTYNRGQRSGSLQPFKNTWNPDVIVTQEGGSSRRYLKAPGYEEFKFGESEGEFMLLSKYPILEHGLIKGQFEEEEANIAAWFELDVGENRRVVIYNVHLPTPRDALRANMFGGALYGILGIPGTPWAERRREREKFWHGRIAYAEQLLAHLDNESLPFLVAGDFNMPAKGHIYRMVASRLRDAHATAGKGFGYTFPGVTRNPLSLFGPWLRLDYLFAGAGWKINWCETEARGRPSQHLSAVARFLRAKEDF